ncbi:MAG TPA: YncE family protein [Vicinamibacteria bacterium]|nr:YncE family protein [Vicinamibacteria bacterium]
MNTKRRALMAVASLMCAPAWSAPPSSPSPATRSAPRQIALPGAPATGVVMDFIAYDPAHRRLWVPAGDTGSVDVIDVATDKVSRVQGFATKETERNGRKRTMGPSSVVVGDGVVYVGNRGDDSICAIDAASLEKGACIKLDSMPDAIALVPSAKEVWVTTQANNSIVVLDASSRSALPVKATITLPGSPECFVVDDARGLVYTNLEDKDRTVAVDVKTRQVAKTWLPDCGEVGPRGLALDHKRNFLFVGCTTRVRVLDAGHDGKQVGSIDVGEGIDAIDYLESRHQLYAAAARAAKLVVAQLDEKGALAPVETIATAPSARNPVVTEKGVAYLTDAHDGSILVVEPPR